MKTVREITNGDDVINSRDVIARIEALTELRDAANDDPEAETIDTEDNQTIKVNADFSEEEYRELKMLESLAEEASGSPDWKYGETLIRDSYFETYAEELAEDCGMIQNSDQWPNRFIDWERAADELKYDYMSVEFGDETYWIRA